MIDSLHQKILEQEEQVLLGAVARTMKAYNEKSTVSNLRDYEAAQKAFETYQSSKNRKLKFRTKTEVHLYLKEQGFDVGGSKLSSKVAEDLSGIPKKDGYWLQADIDNYALYGRLKRLEGTMSADAAAIQEQIKKAELRERKGKADLTEMDVAQKRGHLIERTKVNRELVARMIQLRADEKTDNKIKASEIIALVGGDIEKEKVLHKFLDTATASRMNNYAKPFRFAIAMSELEKEIAILEAEDVQETDAN